MFGANDWWGVGPSVFWHLKELNDSHEINVVGEDGKNYRYQVETVETYDRATAPIEDILAPTDEEQILTLFTNADPWNTVTLQWDGVLVITASRDQDLDADPATPETTADDDREEATSDPNCLEG